MTKLKSFDTLGECDRARALLEGYGIHCEIRNEFGANTAGAGLLQSLPFSYPELWIVDGEKKADAMELLSGKMTNSNE